MMAKPKAASPLFQPATITPLKPPADFTRGFMVTAGAISALCVFSAVVCIGIWLHGKLPW